MQHLDTTDAARLEEQLEAAAPGTVARVTAADGEEHVVHRVPGGWYLPGDLAVTSGDIAGAEPTAVALLGQVERFGEDPCDEEDGR